MYQTPDRSEEALVELLKREDFAANFGFNGDIGQFVLRSCRRRFPRLRNVTFRLSFVRIVSLVNGILLRIPACAELRTCRSCRAST